jgi:hypothetical protein
MLNFTNDAVELQGEPFEIPRGDFDLFISTLTENILALSAGEIKDANRMNLQFATDRTT